MAVRRLSWNSLLHYAELVFEPDEPKVLEVTDELVQSLSWLTAATGHDRRLLRCTEQGALLVADAWSLLASVETAELYPDDGTPDSHTATKVHKGVLISTSTQIVQVKFIRKASGVSEYVYVPPNNYYWYPWKVYSVTASVVPATGGTASYVGVTFYN